MKHNHNHDNVRDAGLELVPVQFEFTHPTATTVCVAGTFNHWRPEAKTLHRAGGGRWVKETALMPGTYEYCLIVDGHWVDFLTAVAAAGGMVALFLKLALVPDRRYTTWVRRAIGSVNAKYLFGLLLIAWIVGMSLLGLQAGGLTHTQIGGLALIGLFAGVFVFMGFIWAVIGD